MKLYYAGMMGAQKNLRDHFVENIPAPRRVMFSFAYLPHIKRFLNDYYPDLVSDGFLDSGAWTAYNLGVPVDRDEYGQFATEHRHQFNRIANLDEIADWTITRDNWLYLNKEYSDVEFLPVYHIGEPVEVLEFYLDHNPSIMLIGGVAGKMFVQGIMAEREFDFIFSRYMYKYHIFGVNTISILMRFPFYSCDATTWRSGSRFGEIVTPYGRFKVGRSGLGSKDSRRKDVLDWLWDNYKINPHVEDFHYSTLDKLNMQILYDLLEVQHKGINQHCDVLLRQGFLF